MDSIVLEKPSSSTIHEGGGGGGGGGRAIDRHNPIIRDEKRLGQGRIFPSNSTTNITTDHNQHKKPPEVEEDDQKKKSVAFANDDEFIKRIDPFMISPASSSRCLLSDKAKFNFISQFHHVLPQSSPSSPREPFNSLNENAIKTNYDYLLSSPPSPAPQLPPLPPPYDSDDEPLSSSPPKPPPSPPRDQPPPSSDQVVVLEVSLHCRGCERKMKKHISKIEGVTSFKIDFAAKKVTVIGDVTPLTVLTSVLKVKNAKLLTPATISSSPSQTGYNRSQS